MIRTLTTARASLPKVIHRMVLKKTFSTETEVECLKKEVRSLRDQNLVLQRKLTDTRIEIRSEISDSSIKNTNEIIRLSSESSKNYRDIRS